MSQIILYCVIFLSLKCNSAHPPKTIISEASRQDEIRIITGAERTESYFPVLKGKKIGLIVNQTSMIGSVHLVDSLMRAGMSIKRVFAPEHGFRGDADAGEKINDAKDPVTGLEIISLYGNKKKPSLQDLGDLDLLVFDIQDVGVRFFTYLSTLHYVMEAAAESGIPLIVLDRPNPNGHYIDGPLLNPEYKSFVGLHPVPVVYGMTIGEYAQMINGEKWLNNGIQCKLTVIPVDNYNHRKKYVLPVRPSPNLPNLRSILLYPSICYFEGTTVSIGRGTTKQFQVLGHPKLKSDYSFTPSPNPGAKDPPHKGLICYGTDLSTVSEEQLFDHASINLNYVISYYKQLAGMNEKFFLDNLFFDKLAGTDQLRKQISDGRTATEIKESWQADLQKFKQIRKKYLLYR
jgi:uncharacterized protein YbbC (DUF1343 family)